MASEELDGPAEEGDFGDFDDFADALAEASVEEVLDSDEEDLPEEELDGEALELEALSEERPDEGAGRAERRRKAPPPRRAGLATPPQVVRLVPPAEHMTSDYLTTYEISNVLAVRATQIEKHNMVFLPPGEARASNCPVQLAIQELLAGMNPLEIRRARSHGGEEHVEVRKVRDLLILPTAPGIYD